jgi:hypothetical protein
MVAPRLIRIALAIVAVSMVSAPAWAAGGCGQSFHRTPQGRCTPNWNSHEKPCPTGYHRGLKNKKCWPN